MMGRHQQGLLVATLALINCLVAAKNIIEGKTHKTIVINKIYSNVSCYMCLIRNIHCRYLYARESYTPYLYIGTYHTWLYNSILLLPRGGVRSNCTYFCRIVLGTKRVRSEFKTWEQQHDISNKCNFSGGTYECFKN